MQEIALFCRILFPVITGLDAFIARWKGLQDMLDTLNDVSVMCGPLAGQSHADVTRYSLCAGRLAREGGLQAVGELRTTRASLCPCQHPVAKKAEPQIGRLVVITELARDAPCAVSYARWAAIGPSALNGKEMGKNEAYYQ